MINLYKGYVYMTKIIPVGIVLFSFVLLLSFQNCGRQGVESQILNSVGTGPGPTVACKVGSTTSCYVEKGIGKRFCIGPAGWDVCKATLCDTGYALINGRCEVQVCPYPPSGENSCSDRYNIGRGICNGTKGVQSCQSLACRPFKSGAKSAGETSSDPRCLVQCAEGSACQEHNGYGVQKCGGVNGPFCDLSRCEPGFEFEPNQKICVSNECVPNSNQACSTQWGPGTRKCDMGRWDLVCEPTSCPKNFELAFFNGYKICAPILCNPDQYRDNAGNCIGAVYAWLQSGFNTCSPPCGGTCTETQTVKCRRGDGVFVEDNKCPLPKPDTTRQKSGPSCSTTTTTGLTTTTTAGPGPTTTLASSTTTTGATTTTMATTTTIVTTTTVATTSTTTTTTSTTTTTQPSTQVCCYYRMGNCESDYSPYNCREGYQTGSGYQKYEGSCPSDQRCEYNCYGGEMYYYYQQVSMSSCN